jgi:hypothetical protein
LCGIGGQITANGIECTNNAALSGHGFVEFEYPYPPDGQAGSGFGGAFCLTNCMMFLSNGWFVSNSTSCSPAYNYPQAEPDGGAIFNAGAAVLIDADFISNNCPGINGIDGRTLSGSTDTTQSGGDGAGGIGGAVCNIGLLAMTNCTFTANIVTGGSGGPGNTCYACNLEQTGPTGALGGALANFGTANIVSNAFLNNSASGPGADVGTIYSVGNLDIDAATIISPDSVENNAEPFAPLLVFTPESQTVPVGSTVTLNALAVGSPVPAYQWVWDGSNLLSATAATLILTNVQLDESGTYWVEATNSSGSQTSAPIVLTVLPPMLAGTDLGTGGFSVSSAGISGVEFIVEVSSDLINWEPVQTNSSPFTFVDTNASDYPYRFYRAVIAH